jgi:dethiobiotin synthetase
VRIVILGTGTSVGKTFVTAALAEALRPHEAVLALKPIETGVDARAEGDAGVIASSAGHQPRLSRWRYPLGVSPHLAARERGESIQLEEVVAWVVDQERGRGRGFTLVESAGGAYSPLGPGVSNVELAQALEPAFWLLVAPDSLGVLHDVSVALRALPRAPDGVALSSCRPADASSGRNAAELLRLGVCEVLFALAPGSRDLGDVLRWPGVAQALKPRIKSL